MVENNEKEIIEEESKKHKIKNFFGTLVTIALVGLAIYTVMGVYTQKKTGELFFLFGYRPVTILSGSMEPELETGAIVLTKKTKDIKNGDVMFFLSAEGTPVIHRCVGKESDGRFITKGDNNSHEDYDRVGSDQVLGKVIWKCNAVSSIVRKFID